MKWFLSALLLGVVLSSEAASAAIDVSGKWSGFPIYLTLKQEGNVVTGSAGETVDDQIPFPPATLEDDRLVLKFGTMEIAFTIQGDQMTGDARNDRNSIRIVMKRMKPRDPSAPPPAFDAATVKRTAPDSRGSNMKSTPGRLTSTNVSLKHYVVAAWGLKDYQVTGPDWIDNERYDLTATMPAGTPTDEVFSMLQTLLKERFGLTMHRETKELPVYALVVEKGGLKLPLADGFGGTSVSGGPRGRTMNANVTMKSLAGTLSGLVDKPVIDMTEAAGGYKVKLEWTPDSPGSTEPDIATGPTIYMALHQVGLKLESRKAPVEILVVDSANKIPAEN
jgi:uncharacterized protein (TIGR03435 family)